ncbi:late competence development ComFB family protein [Sporosarcina sp. YIM B06819]|uniref:late competence development ComFB family protein n=1 Tax=Sporosarcina sp. YIM B06819 TaxID=3081769 RepID=UPI00298C46C8|nr:late competence development ComFB family protein [Sporosarcina sp. YIM B06819]
MSIHNVMEEIVSEVLVKYQEKLQLTCECERCLDDIRAIALNNLPPHYIVQMKHSPYVRAPYTADRQGVTNIMLVVTKAAGIVSSNPRCGEHASTK